VIIASNVENPLVVWFVSVVVLAGRPARSWESWSPIRMYQLLEWKTALAARTVSGGIDSRGIDFTYWRLLQITGIQACNTKIPEIEKAHNCRNPSIDSGKTCGEITGARVRST
jgi:hypothetical protein